MKKIIFLLIAALQFNMNCFAAASFESNTGIITIRNMSIDGATNFDSIKLKLNTANGTYEILEAIPKSVTISQTPLDTLEREGIKVDFLGCTRSGRNQVSCHINAVNNNTDQFIHFDGYDLSHIFDNMGKRYNATFVTTLGSTEQTGFIAQTLVQGIQVRIVYVFDNIDIRATSFPLLRLGIRFGVRGVEKHKLEFSNIDF